MVYIHRHGTHLLCGVTRLVVGAKIAREGERDTTVAEKAPMEYTDSALRAGFIIYFA